MSYDLYLEADLGGPEPSQVGDLDWNYTSNCAPMWRLAMPESDGLAGMHGMSAGVAANVLRAGIARMEKAPNAYRALNPDNGWGDFDSQLASLWRLLAAFEAHPRAIVAVSR
jgi:hypothetical protein